MAAPQSSDPPETEEVGLSKELSVYAAIAGITLSHESIPLLGAENPLNKGMVLFSVGLIIAVVSVYVGNRFDTADSGLATARSLSIVLLIYLISNGTRGFFIISDLDPSGNIQSLLTWLVFITLFIIVRFRRLSVGSTSDYEVGRDYEENADWSKNKLLKNILLRSILVSLPFVFLALTDPQTYLLPVIFGYSSGWYLSMILSVAFFRSGSLEDISSGTASVVFVVPSSIII